MKGQWEIWHTLAALLAVGAVILLGLLAMSGDAAPEDSAQEQERDRELEQESRYNWW